MNIPDLTPHLFQFEERVVVFPARDLSSDAVSIGTLGSAFRQLRHGPRVPGQHSRPLIGIDFGMRVARTLAPMIAARPSGAASNGVAFLHQRHPDSLSGGADCG